VSVNPSTRDNDLYGYVIRLEESTDGEPTYVAEAAGLPGCMAHGSTPTEAKTNLDEARALYLADLRARGLAAPTPRSLSEVSTVASSSTVTIAPVEEPVPIAGAAFRRVA
jgi:predicted RNase H-like HicB family nuclease